jgi:thiol-disulfide isomerase/thioredoxin
LRIRRFALPILALAFLTALLPHAARAQALLPAGKAAPDFQTRDLNGNLVSPKAFRGHVLLMDFWATWCGPCRATIPILQRVQERFYKDGVYVVGVSIDGPDTSDEIVSFAANHNIRYIVARPPANIPAVARSYRFHGIPALYLIDKSGHVRWSGDGLAPNEEVHLTQLIRSLLAEK